MTRGIEVGVNVTGTATAKLKELDRTIKEVQKAGSGLLGQAGGGVGVGKGPSAVMGPERLKQLTYQKTEEDLQKKRKALISGEQRLLQVEWRNERTQMQGQTRMMGMFQTAAAFPMGAPTAGMGMLMRGGYALRAKSVQYQEIRRERIGQLIGQGKSLQQAQKEVSSDPKMMGMAVKAAMSNPVALVAAGIGAGLLITYKASAWSRDIARPFRAGMARENRFGPGGIRSIIGGSIEDVAGFGKEGTLQYLGGLQRRMYGGGRGLGARRRGETTGRAGLRNIGEMAQAMGVDVQTTLGLQNLYTQAGFNMYATPEFRKFKSKQYKVWDEDENKYVKQNVRGMYYMSNRKKIYDAGDDRRELRAYTKQEVLQKRVIQERVGREAMMKDVMARVWGTNRGNMGQAMQAVTQIGGAQMAATGYADPTTSANMVAMFGGRLLPQIAPVVNRMAGTMRAAAGAGTEREQFYLRAFSRLGYQGAIEAMEGGITPEKYKMIKEQLGKEGWGKGFMLRQRMKHLGIFSTTLQAKSFEAEAEYNKKYGVPKTQDELDARKKSIEKEIGVYKAGIGGYGQIAASIEAKTIKAGLLVIQDPAALKKMVADSFPGKTVAGLGEEWKLFGKVGIKKGLQEMFGFAKETWETTEGKGILKWWEDYNKMVRARVKKLESQEKKRGKDKSEKETSFLLKNENYLDVNLGNQKLRKRAYSEVIV